MEDEPQDRLALSEGRIINTPTFFGARLLSSAAQKQRSYITFQACRGSMLNHDEIGKSELVSENDNRRPYQHETRHLRTLLRLLKPKNETGKRQNVKWTARVLKWTINKKCSSPFFMLWQKQIFCCLAKSCSHFAKSSVTSCLFSSNGGSAFWRRFWFPANREVRLPAEILHADRNKKEWRALFMQ